MGSTRLFFRQPIQRVRNLWWARHSVSWHARRLHVTQPYSIISSTSALSIRILSSRGALGRSYSSRMYFRRLHHALRMCRSTSMERLTLWLTSPPRYTNSFVWLYTWPVASTLNMAVDSGIPFVCKHMISILASDTVRSNAAHTTTITPIIFLSCSGDSVVQFEDLLPEAAPCVAYPPFDLNGHVDSEVGVPPEVYELVRLVVHLARCLYAEYGGRLRHFLRA